jgi:hypothetical protein
MYTTHASEETNKLLGPILIIISHFHNLWDKRPHLLILSLILIHPEIFEAS